MSKFNTIEISNLVALHPKVDVKRFFGLFERVTYQPTHSVIGSYRNYYTKEEADLFQQIAEEEDPELCLKTAQEVHTSASGNYRVDLCISEDCQFAAFQVFELQRGEYAPYSKLRFLEGESARVFENLIV